MPRLNLLNRRLSSGDEKHTDFILAALSIVGIALFLLATRNPIMGWGDNAMYLMHARNLVSGAAYNATGYIQNPDAYLAPQSYPPGFPLALAPVYALLGLNVPGLVYWATLIYVGSLVAFAGLIRRDLYAMSAGRWAWLGLMGIVGLNPTLVSQAAKLYSDGLFLLTIFAGLWALQNMYARYARATHWKMLAVVAGCLMAAASLTRVFGLILILTVPVFEWLYYRRLTWPGTLSVVLALILYVAVTGIIRWDSVAVHGGSNSGYKQLLINGLLDNAARLPKTILDNISKYVGRVGDYIVFAPFWSEDSRAIDNVFVGTTVLTLLVALIGYAVTVLKRFSPREVFCVLYMLSLLPWLAGGTRYIAPVIPLFFFYTAIGLKTVVLNRRSLFISAIGLAVLACSITYSGFYRRDFSTYTVDSRESPTGAAATDMFRYVRDNTPRNAVFLFRKPRMLALMTERQAATFADNMNPIPNDFDLFRYMQSIRVSYLLTGPPDEDSGFKSFIARHSQQFDLMHRNQQFALYQWVDAAHD